MISKQWFNVRRYGLLMALTWMLTDQASKQAVLATLQPGDSIPVIPGFFNLVLAYNRGISYSMLSDHPFPYLPYVLAAVAIAASILFVQMMGQENRKLHVFGFAALIGGALGNMVDRLMHGAVIDFIHLYYNGFSWYVFNVADTAICLGVAALLLDMLFAGKEKPRGEQKEHA